MKTYTKLDLADAQFIGYSNGKYEDLMGMVRSMGLTKDEWEEWKKKYPQYPLLTREIKEIDEHFKNEQ